MQILTAQKTKFSVNDFFGKCYQIHTFFQICSHLLKKSLTENFIFYRVYWCKQNALTRILRIVFKSGLCLIFKPYLTRIRPVQVEMSETPFVQSFGVDPTVGISYQYPLPNSLRTTDCKTQLSSVTIWKWLIL